MTVETASYIADLNDSFPSNTDFLSEGDNHITMIKNTLQNTFNTTSGVQYDMDLIKDRAENYSVPIGAIVMWYGPVADIPSGWVICNGSTHARTDGGGNITTPNLVAKFIRGAGGDISPNTVGGQDVKEYTVSWSGAHIHANPNTDVSGEHNHSGFTANHILTLSQIPWHNHGGGNHNHTFLQNKTIALEGGPYVHASSSLETKTTDSSGVIINGEGGGQPHSHGISVGGEHFHVISPTETSGGHTHTVNVNHLPPFRNMLWIMKT